MKETILNFQYQFSKLFNIGLNRKKFEIKKTEDKLYAMNTSKNTIIALLFTLFASCHLFSGLIVGLNSIEELGIEFYTAFTFLFIIGIIGFRQFLWLANGRQELTIENRTLTLYKKGTFLTKPKKYDLDNVRNIRLSIDEENLSMFDKIQYNIGLNRKVIFGHIIGQILFDYKGKTVKLFNELDKSERLRFLNEINKWK